MSEYLRYGMNADAISRPSSEIVRVSMVQQGGCVFSRPSSNICLRIYLRQDDDGAGDGNRTHATSLEGWSSTIELRPQKHGCITDLQ